MTFGTTAAFGCERASAGIGAGISESERSGAEIEAVVNGAEALLLVWQPATPTLTKVTNNVERINMVFLTLTT